jgi:hypothetical protein
MPAPSSPKTSQESQPDDATKLVDALHDEEEATEVMGKEDLPDFDKDGRPREPERRPSQRPSTFTRLLIDPRR